MIPNFLAIKNIKNRRVLPGSWVHALRKDRANTPSPVTHLFFFGFTFVNLLWSISLFAQTVTIPHLINFQSVLSDAGGVPLPDGVHSVRFRLLDASQQSLYEEKQSVESLSGVVSAMIGAGGELPVSILAPGQAKFLGVQADNSGPETVLEIVSTPYAFYAEQALQVAPKSIGKEAILPKSITADLLADDVLQGILPANLVYQSNLDVLKGDYRSAFGAGKIGVDTNFVYSRGPTVQDVLKDFDTALSQRQANIEKQKSDLTTSINNNVQTLNANIATTAAGLQNQINGVSGNMATKSYVDSKVQTAIDNNPPPPATKQLAAFLRYRNGQIISQYNVASVVYAIDGGGSDPNYVINFSAPLSNSNYGVLPVLEANDSSGYLLPAFTYFKNKTTSSVTISATGVGTRDLVVYVFDP